jgi:hypothetical protein
MIEPLGTAAERLAAAARDAAFITIGFGVLTMNQVQVRRRELLGSIERVLPPPATQAIEQAHLIAKTAGEQLRGIIRNTR